MRALACIALGELAVPGPQVTAALGRLAADPDPRVRLDCARALARLGDPRGQQLLERLSEELAGAGYGDHPYLREDVAAALGYARQGSGKQKRVP